MNNYAALSNREMAALTNRLQAPVVVHDIMHNNGEFNDDVQYALHEIISDYKPDAALLCIALSMKKIASIYSEASPIMGVVAVECSKVIDDYAQVWLDFAYRKEFSGDDCVQEPLNPVEEAALIDILEHVPEDLEGLADLLELASDFLKGKNTAAARICEIFKIQAISHAMIAEEFLKAYANGDDLSPSKNEETLTVTSSHRSNDNIVAFPGHA